MPHRCPLYPEVLRVALNSLPALRSFPPDPLHAGPRQELSQEHSLGALLSFGPQEGGASAGVGLAGWTHARPWKPLIAKSRLRPQPALPQVSKRRL